jgi:uncharacterized protein (TIGR03067 family)
MRRSALLLSLAILGLAFAPIPFPSSSEKKTDLKKLSGDWVMEYEESTIFGRTHPKLKITIVANRIIYSEENNIVARAAMCLDAQKSPKAMDLLYRCPDIEGEFEIKAVYQVDKERLIICYSPESWETRPVNISRTDGNQIMQVFKRQHR